MMTEACGTTNCTIMEVGEAISSMMKVCSATSRLMKDELIVGKHQVDGTRLLIYVMYKLFCHTCVTSKMLLQPVPS